MGSCTEWKLYDTRMKEKGTDLDRQTDRQTDSPWGSFTMALRSITLSPGWNKQWFNLIINEYQGETSRGLFVVHLLHQLQRRIRYNVATRGDTQQTDRLVKNRSAESTQAKRAHPHYHRQQLHKLKSGHKARAAEIVGEGTSELTTFSASASAFACGTTSRVFPTVVCKWWGFGSDWTSLAAQCPTNNESIIVWQSWPAIDGNATSPGSPIMSEGSAAKIDIATGKVFWEQQIRRPPPGG